MKIRNDQAKGIFCTQIAEKYIAAETVRYAPEPRKKRLITVILLSAVFLLAVLSAHFLIKPEKTYLNSDDKYTMFHLLGVHFLFHNTVGGFPAFHCIDIEKDSVLEISALTSYHKKYTVFIFTQGVKIYDHGKYVSGYENENRMETISSFIADYDGDGNEDLFLLLKKKEQIYGEKLMILNYDGKKAVKTYDASFQKVNPWKVQVCDVDGDGKMEVSLGVYTLAKYHPVYAKRPFLYEFHNHQLYPKWLGSRLSRPFDDYLFCDVDGDKKDELISVETTRDGKKELNAYKWTGFGFESIGVSRNYDIIRSISADGKTVTAICGSQAAAESKTFIFRNAELETGG